MRIAQAAVQARPAAVSETELRLHGCPCCCGPEPQPQAQDALQVPPAADITLGVNVTQPLLEATGQLRWALNNVVQPPGPPCQALLGEVYAEPAWPQQHAVPAGYSGDPNANEQVPTDTPDARPAVPARACVQDASTSACPQNTCLLLHPGNTWIQTTPAVMLSPQSSISRAPAAVCRHISSSAAVLSARHPTHCGMPVGRHQQESDPPLRAVRQQLQRGQRVPGTQPHPRLPLRGPPHPAAPAGRRGRHHPAGCSRKRLQRRLQARTGLVWAAVSPVHAPGTSGGAA